MKKRGFVLIVIYLVLLFGGAYQGNAQEIKTQEIVSIEEPKWIFNAGTSKGRYHDRQDLGFVLQKNTVLKIRQTNPQFKDKLTVRLLGNDSKKEQSVKVGSDWITISSKEESLVPFVDTPYNAEGAMLMYEIESDQASKPLPIYELNDNEDHFFKLWDSSDAEYALIKGNDFQLLLPKLDEKKVQNLKDFDSLNTLIEHYNDLFRFYNQMAGFDDSAPTNKNGTNRYFLKADINGAGGAYYGSYWTASTESTTDMWLKKVSWGTLHEIAHGYQTGFDGQGMYTGEVSNNLFGVQYQYEKYGKHADKIGWLFNYGKKDAVEKNLYTKIVKNDGTYASVNNREKLILLTMLKQKAGNVAFTKMYQDYRVIANQPDFKRADYPLPDLLNRNYSDVSQLDFTPVLERWGLSLQEGQADINRHQNYPAVASLADVVPEGKLVAARALIDPNLLITSNFEIVKNEEIAALGLQGTATIQLKVNDLDEVKGTKIRLKEGNKVVQEKEITSESVLFNQLPNGVYTIEFVGEVMTKYIASQQYLYVKESENNIEIKLSKLNVSSFMNQSINFLGLSDRKFGEFKTNLNEGTGTVSVTSATPHKYYSGETYMTVKVSDENGVEKYSKVIEGTEVTVKSETISLVEGDRVEIYHAETRNRLTSTEEIINKTEKTNTWLVTSKGLENIALPNNLEQELIKKIEAEGTELLQNERRKDISIQKSNVKKNLLLAIQSLPDPVNTQLIEKYAELFLSSKPQQGQAFEYTFKGVYDRVFATLIVSLNEGKGVIKTQGIQPHSYFNEKYASIIIQDQNGLNKYSKEYIGKSNYRASQEEVSIKVGDYITVYHTEFKNRLLIQNQGTRENLETKETITYQVTADGLALVETSDIPKPKPEDGRAFAYTFKGLSDRVFATMDVALNEGKAVIETKGGQPHFNFVNEKYASIIIQNQKGSSKYVKEYIGSNAYEASREEVSIKVGDYITVYHAEFKNCLLIQNQATADELETKETITYQVTINGLVLVETNDIPKPKPEDGQAFEYTFKGLSDRVFATMSVSLNEGKAVIQTKATQPHWYFTETYASITIQDQNGSIKHTKEYIGRKNYPAEKDEVLLVEGDFITVYHAEFKNRLLIQNQVTTEKLTTATTVIYQVTEDGMELVEVE